MEENRPTLAVIGGTGKQGRGLAYRWARAGYQVYVGSREAARARETAAAIRARLADRAADVHGLDNLSAARQADVVVLSVPYAAHRATLETLRPALQGKILVDVTVPLRPPRVSRVWLPPHGSAALEAQDLLGPDVAVVDAFQNIAADVLWQDAPVEADVLVAGRGKANRHRVMALVEAAGFRAWDAGPLENTVAVEALTSVLIYMNKAYHAAHLGVRVVGR